MEISWTKRQLFGGALSCDVQTSWKDVSDVRQVPDHQECWQDIGDDMAMLVVELLDRPSKVSDSEATAYFFRDLAESNGTTQDGSRFQNQSIILDGGPIAGVPGAANVSPLSTIGIQKIAMGREYDHGGNRRTQEVQWVRIELCVLRLAQVETDVLITISRPVPSADPNEPIDSVWSRTESTFSKDFCRCIASLKVNDWSLFGG